MTPHEQALDVACNHAIFVWENSGMTRATIASAISAYLRARLEIDGAMMCRVPRRLQHEELNGGRRDSRRVEGYNACLADVLASAEVYDADV